MIDHDRIAEVYEGTVGSREFQEASRRRIHWMCAQVAGGQVLDVGCSQGIAAILLGREGHRVVGIDSEHEAIRAARDRLDQEEPHVRERVEFRIGEAGDLQLADASFDAVLLGELLEHQLDQAKPLDEAVRVLRPGGRLVITTPYGIHPYPDHKDPVYLTPLLEKLAADLSITEISLIDRYVGLVAERSSDRAPRVWRRALQVAERRLADQDETVEALRASASDLRDSTRTLERSLQDQQLTRQATEIQRDAAKQREQELQKRVEELEEQASIAATALRDLEEARDRLRSAERQSAAATDQTRGLEAERKAAERELERLHQEVRGVRERLHEIDRGHEAARAELERTEARLEEAEAERQASQAELEEARARQHDLDSRHQTALREAEAVRSRLSALEVSRAATAEEKAKLGDQLIDAHRRLQEERIRGSALESQRDIARQRAADLERQLERLEAELAEGDGERKRAEAQGIAAAAQVEGLETRLRGLVAERDRTAEEVRLVEEGSQRRDAALAEANAERDRLDKRVQSARTRLAEARRKMAELIAEREAARDAALSANRKADQAEAALVRLRERAGLDARRTAERAEALRAETERLGVTVKALTSAKTVLRGTVDSAERQVERERELRQELEARLEIVSRRSEQLERDLAAIRGRFAYRVRRLLWRPFRRGSRALSDTEALPARSREAHRQPDASPRLRVAAVLDEVSAACFAPDCELVELLPEGWQEQLEEHSPQFLLVESAWAGKRPELAASRVLSVLTEECRKRDIPTVLWNNEDPIHFERSLETASRFDHLFTTDADCVPRYREVGGNRTVAALPFAAQPKLHNPAGVVQARSMAPCFAGAWDGDRHADRRPYLEDLLDAARPYGLVIYEPADGSGDPAPGFPKRFQPHIVGQLPYERTADVYKSHEVFLNANAVLDSPTMCSRQVLELAACGTAVLSTPAKALAALLGGAVREAATPEEASAELERLLSDQGYREQLTRSARRQVFARHTYRQRLAEIAAAAGVPFDPRAELRVGGLLLVDDEAGELERLSVLLADQTRPLDELVLGTSAASTLDPAAIERALGGTKVRVSRHEDLSAATLKDLAALASTPWVICPDLDCSYSAFLIEDLQAAAQFAPADVVGTVPAASGEHVVQHAPAAAVHPHGALVRREVVSARGWPRPGADDGWSRVREWGADGLAFYAADADLITASRS